jgi:hypothetical protein
MNCYVFVWPDMARVFPTVEHARDSISETCPDSWPGLILDIEGGVPQTVTMHEFLYRVGIL